MKETKIYMTMISRMMGGKTDEETNKNYINIKKELGVNLRCVQSNICLNICKDIKLYI